MFKRIKFMQKSY